MEKINKKPARPRLTTGYKLRGLQKQKQPRAKHLSIVCYRTDKLLLHSCRASTLIESQQNLTPLQRKLEIFFAGFLPGPSLQHEVTMRSTRVSKFNLTVLFLDTILSSFLAIRIRSSSRVIAAFTVPNKLLPIIPIETQRSDKVWICCRLDFTHGALHSVQRRVLPKSPSWPAPQQAA